MDKKSKLKKLALMGMASGAMIATTLPGSANASSATYLAASCGAGCGGGGFQPGAGCNGQKQPGGGGCNGYRPGCNNYKNGCNGNQPRSGCNSSTQQRGRYNTADADTMPRQQMHNKMHTSMSESELLSKLSPEGTRMYQNLSPEGKELARKLAAQDMFKDKNEAVKAAAKKTNPSTTSETPWQR